MAAWERRSEAGTADRKTVAGALTEWRADPDLAFGRLPVHLAKLPAAERDDWRSLWADVDALRTKAAGRP